MSHHPTANGCLFWTARSIRTVNQKQEEKNVKKIVALLLVFILLGCLAASAETVDTDALFQEARKASQEKDYEKANAIFLQLYEAGDHRGPEMLASAYAAGQGVEKNVDEAIRWNLIAAEEFGAGRGYTNIGQMYEKGEGVEQSYDKALAYYDLSMDESLASPDFKGARYAGVLYSNGFVNDEGETVQDDAVAVRYYQVAADNGDMTGNAYLGRAYDLGAGVEVNKELAVKYYSVVVNASSTVTGVPEAIYALAKLYENGEGTQVDLNQARELYEKALAYGVEEAQADLERLNPYEGYTLAEFAALQQTTVVPSSASATGYVVTFRYPDNGYTRVRLSGEFNFSDEAHTNPFMTAAYSPFEWYDGCFPALVTKDNQMFEMTLDADNQVWSITLPLPNGTYNYAFYLNGDAEGLNDTAGAEYVFDPNNIPLIYKPDDELSHMEACSAIYVPWDEVKQAKTAHLDAEMPREDVAAGTVTFATVQNASGQDFDFGIYLPADFDENRAEPYKVLVYQTGGGCAENVAFTAGCAHTITDNLIADGVTDSFIIVTPNGNDFRWDREVIMDGTINAILPYMVENYNVSADPADRAYLGISMGGATCVYAMIHDGSEFGSFAVFSAPVSSDIDEVIVSKDLTACGLEDKSIFVSWGDCDMVIKGRNSREGSLYEILDALTSSGLKYTNMVYHGGHQFTVWRQSYAYYLENVLWK